MEKFNTKRSVSERNKMYETYKICYFLFLILIFIDIVIKFNFYDFDLIFSSPQQWWLEFWIESIIFVIIFLVNIIMFARKGITIGAGNLPKDIFPKRRYAYVSAKVGLIVAVSLWLFRALTGAYPGSWYQGFFACVILMICTFIVVFLLSYLILFIAHKIAINYNNSNKISKIGNQRLITENNEKNKIYKICYFLFLILIFLDMIIKFSAHNFLEFNSRHWWQQFGFEFIFFIMILCSNIMILASHGIIVGLGKLPNNVFHKGRYALISTIIGLIVSICLYGYIFIWRFIDDIIHGWLWNHADIMIIFILFLLTFIAIFLLSYIMFYIGYKIALEHNNRIIIDELDDPLNKDNIKIK